ncbi:MAG: BREX-1 system adenine-specific DNA-methyltransferase PglX [Methylococcales bacterium]|nr:BREX-1 system adenine-specific DNA-methyltransferase PglX [Methylococcales bacterium]
MFVERAIVFAKQQGGNVSFVRMHSWMFLPSFEEFRRWLIENGTFQNMAHLGPRAFSEISGEVVQSTAFSYLTYQICDYYPTFINATDGEEEQKQTVLLDRKNRHSHISQSQFQLIPGCPIAYWVTSAVTRAFGNKRLSEFSEIKSSIGTSNNNRFLRFWNEVNFDDIGFGCSNIHDSITSKKKWFPYTKGGRFRKWYGNNEFVVNWESDGLEIKVAVVNNPSDPNTTHWSRRIFNTEYFFLPSITWSDIGGGLLSVRKNDNGFIHDVVGVGAYRISQDLELEILAALNSCVATVFVDILCPTLHFKPGQMGEIPIVLPSGNVANNAGECVALAKQDWDANETSWGFDALSWCVAPIKANNIQQSWDIWARRARVNIERMQSLENDNNHFFIKAFGLQDELSPDVPEEQITLARADREKDCQRLISYAIGCMMGRYSLNKPGLIYAQAGNVGFDPDRYNTFSADADGIVPITDELWFEDDAANRIREFLLALWNAETLDENIAWLAESLGQKGNETPIETIRRYLAGSFFKDHLQTYKKRLIYWLFSSGKQGAFQALVYLHRYHESTLARMRAEYVVPLTGKIQSRIEMLEKDAAVAASNATRNRLNKDIEKLKKKHVELLAYDEKLRHYADLRIQLDLDDGVKVNYGKFGDLLAEVKAVTGGKDE